MIAMLVVGAILLVAYVLYERFLATVPSFPRRLLYNKTFMSAYSVKYVLSPILNRVTVAIVIDFFYLMAGNLRSLYLSSYTYIVCIPAPSNSHPTHTLPRSRPGAYRAGRTSRTP